MLAQFLINGIIDGCLIALMSVGFALIYNTTRILHIAHGAIYTAAAYFCYIFLTKLTWGLWPSIIVSLLLTSVLGVMVEVWVYSPLYRRNASALVLLLSSLGLYIVLVNVIALVFGNETQSLIPAGQVTYKIGSILITHVQLIQAVVTIVLLPLLLLLLRYSALGRKVRAMRDNPQLASVMGANLFRTRMIVFALGSAVSGMAAILSAMDLGVNPGGGLRALLIAAVGLIVGGVGSFEGAVLGGVLLGVLQSIITWRLSGAWVDASTFGLLVLFLLTRPDGLMGRRQRIEERTA